LTKVNGLLGKKEFGFSPIFYVAKAAPLLAGEEISVMYVISC